MSERLVLFVAAAFIYLIANFVSGRLLRYLDNNYHDIYEEVRYKSKFIFDVKKHVHQESYYVYSTGINYFKKLIFGFGVNDKTISAKRVQAVILYLLFIVTFAFAFFI